MTRLNFALRRFRSDEGGQLLVETVLVLPVLLWAYISLFTYWDAFREVNNFQKASYSVADMLSRNQSVNMNYVIGLQDTIDFLIQTDETVQMRVTSITYSGVRNRFEVLWSRSPYNAMPQLTTNTLQNYRTKIPNMTDGDTVVILETALPYKPSFSVGMPDQVFRQFIVTRPRFYPRVELTS